MQRRLKCTETYRTREKIDLGQPALGASAQEWRKVTKNPQGWNMTAPATVDLNVAAQIPVLHGLKPESLAVLLMEASVVNLRPGHPLFRQGEPAVAFFIIVDGWIKLYRVTPAGDEAVLNVLTTGESFAEALTLTSGRYPATACAA